MQEANPPTSAQLTTGKPVHRQHRPLIFLALLWVLIPALVLAFLLVRFEWTYRERIFPGVQVMGVELAGKTRDEAAQALRLAIQDYSPPPVMLRYGDQVWQVDAQKMGAQVSVARSLNRAFARGRSDNFFRNLQVQWQTFWQGYVLTPSIKLNRGATEQWVRSLTASFNSAASESQVSLSELQVVITASHPGQRVDVDATVAAILTRAQNGAGGIVDIKILEIPPAGVLPTANKQTIEDALRQPILLADPDGEFQFSLDPATLAQLVTWIQDDEQVGTIKPEADEEALRDIAEKWATQIYRPPLNARYDYDPKRGLLLELAPSATGYELDVDATVATLVTAIESGEKQVTLPVTKLKPDVASEDAQQFGIKELVAKGSTRFAGSSRARVKNIEVAASKFVGVVIPPDGVFSFNKYVGDVTAANGFEDSLIIAGDRTAVGVGGGVCQVSSTVFRTAFFGGFPILERWAHGYVVHWYGEPGIDATVYTPRVDLKFRNTTGHYLLIKPVVDTKKGILTFEFYGSNPGWKVEVGKPAYTNRQNPPPPLYIEDATMPAGQVTQIDWAVAGMDAAIQRKVWDASGQVIIDEVLKSSYKPWQAKFRFGPGYQPPAGAEIKRAGE